MKSNDIDEMLNSLNSINDNFINNYFDNDDEISIKLDNNKTKLKLKDEKRLFGLDLEIEKVSPKVDEILELIDNSSNGEDFFSKIEDEFGD